MGTTGIIIVIAFVVLFVIGIRRTFKIILFLLAIVLALYFFKPEVLGDWFGKKNVEKVEKSIKKGTEKAKKSTQELGDKIGDAVEK